jgi:hypothetical protein
METCNLCGKPLAHSLDVERGFCTDHWLADDWIKTYPPEYLAMFFGPSVPREAVKYLLPEVFRAIRCAR